MDINKKPKFSFDQAANVAKEKKDSAEGNAKEAVKGAPISYAMPEDRQKYLNYCASLLQDVSERIKDAFCNLTGKAPVCYTTKEVAGMLRNILVLRIHGYTYKFIGRKIGESEEQIKLVEKLALNVVKDAIARKRNAGMPLLGGMN